MKNFSHDLLNVMLVINFYLYDKIFYAVLFVAFYYDNKKLEKQSFIFPNLLHSGYEEVNVLISV